MNFILNTVVSNAQNKDVALEFNSDQTQNAHIFSAQSALLSFVGSVRE
jgi:hypothetical protein